MKNFLISAVIDIILIFVSYFTFRVVISGPTRHRIYEKYLHSMSRFIVSIFIVTAIITGVSAYVLHRTRYIVYLNIIAPSLVSIFIGFVISLVPTRGEGDKKPQ